MQYTEAINVLMVISPDKLPVLPETKEAFNEICVRRNDVNMFRTEHAELFFALVRPECYEKALSLGLRIPTLHDFRFIFDEAYAMGFNAGVKAANSNGEALENDDADIEEQQKEIEKALEN